MARSIHKEKFALTASSGSATGNSNRFLNGILREVLSSPATGSTTYDITITSPEGLIIYQTTSQIGDMADEVTIPVRGVHTVSIANATADELITVNLIIDEG